MGQFKKIRCTTCGASIEVWKPEEIPEYCPSCGDYFADEVAKQGGGTGLTTASTFYHLDDERTNSN